jgi:hypothetical protein
MSHLEIAADRLHRIEQLLLQPTPEAIRESEVLLEQVAIAVSEYGERRSAEATSDGEKAMAHHLCTLCERVTKLLEGARRAQWIRMRLITSLSHTYTARAEGKTWYAPCGTINVRM